MSEPIDINAQILALLQRQVGTAPAVTGIAPAFGQPAPMVGALPNPVGLLVPVALQTRDGEVTVYMQFGPECAQPQLVPQLLDALQANGWPLKAWRPKQDNGGRGGFGGGGRGGWGR